MAKAKNVSPRGIAIYPYLITPDEYEGSKTYKVTLALDCSDAEVQTFINKIKAQAEAAFEAIQKQLKETTGQAAGKAKKLAKELSLYLPFEDELDEDGNETGRVRVNFKSNATYIDKKTKQEKEKKIPIFDSSGKPCQLESLWGGSVIKVAYTFSQPWKNPVAKTAGTSLYISAVQVIELVAGGVGNAESYGFGAEDGFAYEGTEAEDDSTDKDENEEEEFEEF